MALPQSQSEIDALAARLGSPLRWQREYLATTPRNDEWVRRLVKRSGEVILLVPRPDARVLLHTKTSYPEGVYRLPGGGINRDEPVDRAAQREMMEEMGFDVPLSRFLGVVENVFLVNGEHLLYPSFVFATGPTATAPRVMDPDEEIADFREVSLESLSRVAAHLDGLPPDWQPWGRFRAAPHALALQALTTDRG